ncbi:hypothetical protein [Streptomyces sp. LN549]|uniref:hypothetical protein n=1 Tax=Streptomyces sp. LN549 TaxID=3112979 RepID=UPI003715F1CC
MVTSFTRLAVAAAAAAVMAATASPAMAAESGALDTNKTLSNSHGHMTYIDDGDMFEVCDTKADGYGVEGQLISHKQTELYVNDGGDAGCDKGGFNVGNSGPTYQMQFWWSGGGAVQYSDWFDE